MIINSSQQYEKFIDISDICIVGAGPAGITLAQELSKNDSKLDVISIIKGILTFLLLDLFFSGSWFLRFLESLLFLGGSPSGLDIIY